MAENFMRRGTNFPKGFVRFVNRELPPEVPKSRRLRKYRTVHGLPGDGLCGGNGPPGARNIDGPMGWENHAKWQGGVYRWRKGGGEYAEPERRTAPEPMPEPSAPIQTAAPKSAQPAPRISLTPVDVTRKYLDAATPEHGTVTYEDGYKVKNHQAEIDMADWIRRTFGGNIKLLKESKEQGSKTPDFLWNGRNWELKGVTTPNSVDRAIREAAKQIQDNTGGIILNLLDTTQTMESIENAILQRFRRVNLTSLDVLIVSDGRLQKIIRIKK